MNPPPAHTVTELTLGSFYNVQFISEIRTMIVIDSKLGSELMIDLYDLRKVLFFIE